MKLVIVKNEELLDVMQHVNLIKIKFGYEDTWTIAPTLYTTEEGIDIVVDSEKKKDTIKSCERVIFKFQRFGYEYLVSGRVVDISLGQHTTATIKYSMVQKYYNLRKHMRFDTNLKISVNTNSETPVESVMRNISRGGAMIVSQEDLEINSLTNLQITFNSGNCFTVIAKVARKSACEANHFSYGLQFVEVSESSSTIINKVILKYEKEYLKSLHILREIVKKKRSYYDAKIMIFSQDEDESYEIREVLVKLGAENFDVLQDVKFYTDLFIEEKPRIIIIDASIIDERITDIVQDINTVFPEIHIILLMPIEYAQRNELIDPILGRASALYKPLVYNEFQEEIIKYL